MNYEKFGSINKKERFVFQGDTLAKTHLHYITNEHKDFPVNAIYLNGMRIGEKVFFSKNVMVEVLR